jgi:hypothetical protein
MVTSRLTPLNDDLNEREQSSGESIPVDPPVVSLDNTVPVSARARLPAKHQGCVTLGQSKIRERTSALVLRPSETGGRFTAK